MKYKITIEEITEYPETNTVYEAEDGKRYYSTYRIPESIKYTTKEINTGALLTKSRQVYVQEVDGISMTDVIKAANSLND